DDEPAGAKDRARQLRDHVRAYVLPRVQALESPLLVVLLGPTGAGKSTLMNTLARATVSRTGVLRPTTREAVLLGTDADAATLRKGALAGIGGGQIVRAPATTASAGLAIVDAPDLDSVERANRVIADALVEAADLGIFVTSAMRYADKVPFDVVQRIAARGLPLLIVVNRMPPDESEQRVVLEDLRRVLKDTALRGSTTSVFRSSASPRVGSIRRASASSSRPRRPCSSASTSSPETVSAGSLSRDGRSRALSPGSARSWGGSRTMWSTPPRKARRSARSQRSRTTPSSPHCWRSYVAGPS